MKTAGAALRCPVGPNTRSLPMGEKLLAYSIAAPSGCRVWLRSRDKNGYGMVRQPGYANARSAHRVAYELAFGDIPDGYTIDHLCRLKNCIEPKHLQAVEHRHNVARVGNPGDRITRVLTGRQGRKSFAVVHRATVASAVASQARAW